MGKQIEVVVGYDSEDEEISITCETHKVVCPQCNGEGTQLIDAFRGQAVEQDLLEDEDFMEGYWNGRYDEACGTCKGQNVIDEPNVPDEYKKMYSDYLDDKYNYEQECEAERRAERMMGA
jgi:DnaJ-class molecular chaperone